MIHDNIEFFGAVELSERFNGLQLQRIPGNVRNKLNARGKWNSQQTGGLEIRFVCDSPHIRLFLSTLEGDADVSVYRGDFLHSTHHLAPGGPICIHVEPPQKLREVKAEVLQGRLFPSNVWRFVLPATNTVFHELETYGATVRPPSEKEKPSLTWLAYGSSITAGGYVQKTARLLGVDSINMAMGGACHCEPELADFIAERGDWDFATFELGVNMLDSFSPEEFRERAEYLVEHALDKNPGKPIFLISFFTFYAHYQKNANAISENMTAYTEILENMIVKMKSDDLRLIDGRELLTDFSELSCDLIHPSIAGYVQIASNLAAKLFKYEPIAKV